MAFDTLGSEVGSSATDPETPVPEQAEERRHPCKFSIWKEPERRDIGPSSTQCAARFRADIPAQNYPMKRRSTATDIHKHVKFLKMLLESCQPAGEFLVAQLKPNQKIV
eukprot:gene6589-12129_t